jgi:hypothetical protein
MNAKTVRPKRVGYSIPEGSAGYRLWELLHLRTGASKLEFITWFERRNLVCGETYNRTQGAVRAQEYIEELSGSGRTVVLLGDAVRAAFDLAPVLLHPQNLYGVTWRQIPYPSAKNLWYQVPENQHVVALLMEELYKNIPVERKRVACVQ